MNKIYILLTLVAIIIISGLLFKGFNSTSNIGPNNEIEDPVVKGGWIEVLSGKTFLIENRGGTESKKEFATGDVVAEGNVLETDSKGKASIHFFDGSVLRVSPSTRFTIKSAEYDKNSGKLLVMATLSFGKVWSKIIELATPDSLWQVETSNTVATVRGSAFGISSDGKSSEIFGSQHRVVVEVIDPKTKEKLKIQPLIVGEGSFLKVSDTDIQKIKKIEERAGAAAPAERESIMKTSELVFAPVRINEKIRSDEWFSRNENEDKKIEEEIEKTKEKVGDDKVEVKKVFNKKTEERFVEIKNQTEDSPNKEIKGEPAPIEEKVKTSETKEVSKETPEQNSVSLPVKWDSLKIETKSLLGNLVEGDIVIFHAILQGSGGVSKDVTNEVRWEVSGQMGAVDAKGIFSAKLDPLISEYGEGDGFVGATWEGADGNKISGKSGPIHVIMKIEEYLDERG